MCIDLFVHNKNPIRFASVCCNARARSRLSKYVFNFVICNCFSQRYVVGVNDAVNNKNARNCSAR